MDIFGFQFAYAPTALSGIGAFAIVAMIVATAAFAVAYLAGVVMTVRIVTLRERRQEAAKKKRLRDLLAMKAAQDELDVELEREMHGIRPTSNLEEFAILHEEAEQETKQGTEEPIQVSDGTSAEPEEHDDMPAEQVEPSSTESAEPILAEAAPVVELAETLSEPAEIPAEPEVAVAPESQPESVAEPAEGPAFGFSFASEAPAEPESVAVPEPAPESSEPPVAFGFSFATAEPAEASPEPETAVTPEPEEAPAPFGFSFTVSEEPAPAPEPTKAAEPEPEVEMNSFFKAS